jgi:hypothetical protein
MALAVVFHGKVAFCEFFGRGVKKLCAAFCFACLYFGVTLAVTSTFTILFSWSCFSSSHGNVRRLVGRAGSGAGGALLDMVPFDP